MEAHQIAYKIKVTGRVQGVAFRYNSKLKADEMGLIGNVMNQDDGTVLINICGPREDIIRFLDWCKSGPSAAQVQRLDYNTIDIFVANGFNIIR